MGKDNMTLPPLPHLAALALGVLGVIALARFASREKRRVNDELDVVRADAINDAAQRRTLKRDPRTGVYRA
jgi:hypothetical protein